MSLSLQQLGDSTSGSENLLDFAACDDNTALSSSSPSSSALLESSIDCFPSFLTPSPTAGAGVERMAAETGDGVFASSGRAFEAVFAGFDNFDDVEINNSNSKIDCFNSGNDSIATSASTSSSFSKFGVNVCSNMVFSEKLSDGRGDDAKGKFHGNEESAVTKAHQSSLVTFPMAVAVDGVENFVSPRANIDDDDDDDGNDDNVSSPDGQHKLWSKLLPIFPDSTTAAEGGGDDDDMGNIDINGDRSSVSASNVFEDFKEDSRNLKTTTATAADVFNSDAFNGDAFDPNRSVQTVAKAVGASGYDNFDDSASSSSSSSSGLRDGFQNFDDLPAPLFGAPAASTGAEAGVRGAVGRKVVSPQLPLQEKNRGYGDKVSNKNKKLQSPPSLADAAVLPHFDVADDLSKVIAAEGNAPVGLKKQQQWDSHWGVNQRQWGELRGGGEAFFSSSPDDTIRRQMAISSLMGPPPAAQNKQVTLHQHHRFDFGSV
jgi:hypothetical protein